MKCKYCNGKTKIAGDLYFCDKCRMAWSRLNAKQIANKEKQSEWYLVKNLDKDGQGNLTYPLQMKYWKEKVNKIRASKFQNVFIKSSDTNGS